MKPAGGTGSNNKNSAAREDTNASASATANSTTGSSTDAKLSSSSAAATADISSTAAPFLDTTAAIAAQDNLIATLQAHLAATSLPLRSQTLSSVPNDVPQFSNDDKKDAAKTIYQQALTGDSKAQTELAERLTRGIGVTKNELMALIWLSRAAKHDPHAEYLLGNRHLFGRGVATNPQAALACFTSAAAKGSALAQLQLAKAHLGQLTPNLPLPNKDPAEVIKLLTSAAASNHDAQFLLAECYEKGNGTTKDLTKALEYYEKSKLPDAAGRIAEIKQSGMAADVKNDTKSGDSKAAAAPAFNLEPLITLASSGDLEAQLQLANIFKTGSNGIVKDLKLARRWYLTAATQHKNAIAHCEVAILSENGEGGVPKDEKEAFKHYELAENAAPKKYPRGFQDAQHYLGQCHQKGIGTPIDFARAVLYFVKAADQGHIFAMIALGCCHLFGEGVPQNPAKAKELFAKVANESPLAKFNLGWIYENYSTQPAQQALAIRYQTEAANAGELSAMINLEWICRNKNPKDEKQADIWHRKAREQCTDTNVLDGVAQILLGIRCENGFGVAKDIATAKQHYQQAIVLKVSHNHLMRLAMAEKSITVAQPTTNTVPVAATNTELTGPQPTAAPPPITASAPATPTSTPASELKTTETLRSDSEVKSPAHSAASASAAATAAPARPTERPADLPSIKHLAPEFINGSSEEANARIDFQNAALGDPKAQFLLADRLAKGKGVKKDEALALEWLTRADLNGNSEATFVLSNCYSYGRYGIKIQKPTLGFMYLETAAINGSNQARVKYAEVLLSGKTKDQLVTVQINKIEAIRSLKLASEGNDSAASDAKSLLRTWDPTAFAAVTTPKPAATDAKNTQYDRAAITELAAIGTYEGLILTAEGYQYGKYGFEKNLKLAREHYFRAANHSEARAYACWAMGLCYETGEGHENGAKDEKQAFAQYLKASTLVQKDDDALEFILELEYKLAIYHLHGKCTPRDVEKAVIHFTRAVNLQGNHPTNFSGINARFNLGFCLLNSHETSKQQMGFQLLHQVARCNDASTAINAKMALTWCYVSDYAALEKNLDEEKKLHDLAIEQAFFAITKNPAKAINYIEGVNDYLLGMRCEHGFAGLSVNLDEAKWLYNEAIKKGLKNAGYLLRFNDQSQSADANAGTATAAPSADAKAATAATPASAGSATVAADIKSSSSSAAAAGRSLSQALSPSTAAAAATQNPEDYDPDVQAALRMSLGLQ